MFSFVQFIYSYSVYINPKCNPPKKLQIKHTKEEEDHELATQRAIRFKLLSWISPGKLD